MDDTTEETESSMDEQAFKHYKNGRNAEDRGQKDKAHDEFQSAIILDSTNKGYIAAYERTEK